MSCEVNDAMRSRNPFSTRVRFDEFRTSTLERKVERIVLINRTPTTNKIHQLIHRNIQNSRHCSASIKGKQPRRHLSSARDQNDERRRIKQSGLWLAAQQLLGQLLPLLGLSVIVGLLERAEIGPRQEQKANQQRGQQHRRPAHEMRAEEL